MEILEDRLTANMQQVLTEQAEYAASFLKAYDAVLQKAIDLQRNGEKKAIRWICTSYLRSSILVNTYKLHIGIYDDSLYLDQCDTTGCLQLDGIFKYLSDDMDYLKPRIKREMVRVQEYELREFRSYYANYYFILLQNIHTDLIPEITQTAVFRQLQKSSAVCFTYGEYMDKGVLIHEYNLG